MLKRQTLKACKTLSRPARTRSATFVRLYSNSAAASAEIDDVAATLPELNGDIHRAHVKDQSTPVAQAQSTTQVDPKFTPQDCCNLIIELGSRRAQNDEDNADFALARDAISFGLLDKIQEAGGHPTDTTLYFALQLACKANHDQHVHAILQMYDKYWKNVAADNITAVAKHYCETDSTEQCLALFERFQSLGRHVPPDAYHHLLSSLFRNHSGDMALQVLQDMQARGNIKSIMSAEMYYDALTVFAEMYHVKGLEWLWSRAIRQGPLKSIDMGLCTKILSVCGRYGLPILATNVMYFMDSIGMTPRSFHYASLIDSYCIAGDVKNAFNILTIMRDAGHATTMTTCAGILRYMGDKEDTIDRAYFTVQDLKEEGQAIDVAALNVLLDACAAIGDISRAMATFGEYKNWNVQPDVNTLNSLLMTAAISYRKDVALSMIKLFDEQFGIQPDRTSYTQLLTVCIVQEDYEDAFKYLEDMKTQGHQPPIEVYKLLIRQCLLSSDPRAKIAYEEMKGWGYRDYRINQHMKTGADLTIIRVDPKDNPLYESVMAMVFPEKFYVPRA